MGDARGFKDFGGGFLILCLLMVLVLGYVVMRPFLNIFIMGLVFAIISQPLYQWILRKTRQRASLSALLTCIILVVLVIVPCLGLLGLLGRQSIQAYEWVNEHVSTMHLDRSLFQQVLTWQKRLLPQLDLSKIDIGQTLTTMTGALSKTLVTLSTSALKTGASAVWKFLLMLFALFFFIRDGGSFLRWVMHLTPLPASLEREIFERFKGVSESAIYGTFFTAVAQGLLGGIGFLIVGLPALVWGVTMAFFSMIPLVGTAIVWGPAAVLLIFSHRVVAGVFLIIWGIVVIGMSDNILRPLLMRGKSELHPLLIFFSLIGGISAFGLMGILMGPLAVVLAISLLQAYERAARPILDDLDKR
jgi:predicted PurR-regulated permease PerM